MKVEVYTEYDSLSDAAAELIIDIIKNKPEAVFCFATGNTPVGTYEALVKKTAQQKIDFSKCFCIGLDEWIGVPPEKPGTCNYILHRQVFAPLGIKESQIHLFNGMAKNIEAECKKMNEVIDSKGGIDCMLVGVGINGHIGFNEPGVDINLKAHEQELHGTTLESGQYYFNEPTEINKGITLGMAQVMNAKTLLLIANGKNKAAIMKLALEGEVTNEFLASYIQQHSNGIVMIDTEAASQLSK